MKNLATNWKTTVTAFVVFALTVGATCWPQTFTPDLVIKINSVATIFGFAVAKDGNVTGGTKQQ